MLREVGLIMLSVCLALATGVVRPLTARALDVPCIEASKYINIGHNWIFSINGEAGYIASLEKSRGAGIYKVRITDRFYLGEPQIRGFDIRGVGLVVLLKQIMNLARRSAAVDERPDQ